MPRFFGLTPKYMEAVYEQFFYLKYHGGWGFLEAYNLPIKIAIMNDGEMSMVKT